MTSPAPRKRMPRAQRERQMVQIAEEVFADRGYAAAAMDDIAERVGVSKPMLYEYFRSKEGLLLACIAQARAELREVTERAVTGVDGGEEALRAGLGAFFRFVRERRQAWSVLRHEMALIGTSVSAEIEATRRQQTDLIGKLLADYLGPQPISPLRVEANAEFIVGACERLAIWFERHDDMTPDQVTEMAMDLLWNGLSGRAK